MSQDFLNYPPGPIALEWLLLLALVWKEMVA